MQESFFKDHIVPKIEDWPISKLTVARESFIQDLNQYVIEKINDKHDSLESVLQKTIYLEKIRVKRNPWKVDPANEKKYWDNISKELSKATKSEDSEEKYKALLERLVNRYAEEIVGEFYPKTWRFARKFLTSFFKRIYNSYGKSIFGGWGNRDSLLEQIHTSGEVERLRELFPKGTIVLLPMHFSNLDSIQIGYAIDSKVGVPGFSFGAGLNLLDIELVGYFISRLGAYKVDRRKKNPIYGETLKSVSSLSLVYKLNSIFFPGGTRSRSGRIENKLKFGLLQSTIEAQRYILQHQKEGKIIIVPLILQYQNVLEAASLIESNLKSEGKERYIKSKSKVGTFKRVRSILKHVRKSKSEVYLHFAEAMDVFGNSLDQEGKSISTDGRTLNLNDYFESLSDATNQVQRESVYARLLADKVLEVYKKENLILSSHLLAYTAFTLICEAQNCSNIFDLLKIPSKLFKVSKQNLLVRLEQYQTILKQYELDNKINLTAAVKLSAEECVEDGLQYINNYQSKYVLKLDDNDDFYTEKVKVLYYYHNKLSQFDFNNVSTQVV